MLEQTACDRRTPEGKATFRKVFQDIVAVGKLDLKKIWAPAKDGGASGYEVVSFLVHARSAGFSLADLKIVGPCPISDGQMTRFLSRVGGGEPSRNSVPPDTGSAPGVEPGPSELMSQGANLSGVHLTGDAQVTNPEHLKVLQFAVLNHAAVDKVKLSGVIGNAGEARSVVQALQGTGESGLRGPEMKGVTLAVPLDFSTADLNLADTEELLRRGAKFDSGVVSPMRFGDVARIRRDREAGCKRALRSALALHAKCPGAKVLKGVPVEVDIDIALKDEDVRDLLERARRAGASLTFVGEISFGLDHLRFLVLVHKAGIDVGKVQLEIGPRHRDLAGRDGRQAVGMLKQLKGAKSPHIDKALQMLEHSLSTR